MNANTELLKCHDAFIESPEGNRLRSTQVYRPRLSIHGSWIRHVENHSMIVGKYP